MNRQPTRLLKTETHHLNRAGCEERRRISATVSKAFSGSFSLAGCVSVIWHTLWIVAVLGWVSSAALAQAELDLTRAVVIAPASFTAPENKAVQMLLEEVERRTQLRWARADKATNGVNINLQRATNAASMPREGYRIQTTNNGVTITGNDARGVLFGVGHLLRTLKLEKGKVSLPAPLNVTTAPKYPMRGHQLGYRPKTNSYDGWTLAMWEQYIRDLAIFGTNAIELIPPRSDDAADSPHFPQSQMEMMIGMARICDEYGLDVWIWYPALDKDYGDPKTVEFALQEWGEVFKKLPRIDAVLVPGGDPGDTPPKLLLPLLEKQTANLKRYHPKATMWVAPQSFSAEWFDDFLQIIRTEPAWLGGIVYGPQTRVTLPKLRELIPAKYPLRHYPDITHSRHAQFPVPNWDTAFALTEAREIINPRPTQMASIFRLLQPHTVGFIAYSEGCNDDVNKFVWSALGWNPDADVTDVLRAYSRYFIGAKYEDSFAQGLFVLEQNWIGAAATNAGIEITLAQFQAMERSAAPQDLLNWRFQQALYRAYYDAYVRSRLLYETALEEQALERLRTAQNTGALVAMNEAERLLDRAVTNRIAQDRRARVAELAEALFQSIRMQLSVGKYQAIGVGRGANLDTIDFPLNSRLWLKEQFKELRQPLEETERLKRLDEIVNWKNPGPGGFYDDLGKVNAQPHLVRGVGFDHDPQFYGSSHLTTANQAEAPRDLIKGDFRLVGMGVQPPGPYSWWDIAETFYEQPLQMRYTGLDKTAQYRVRVVYAGVAQRLRLVADDQYEIHPLRQKEIKPLEFDVPPAATADGTVTLTWTQGPGSRGPGRGTQIAEVWLIKKQ
ncbi:MAG TPA: glycoside hydrolase family 20 zincin-like fold domain-containing protein [Blastocatellia bacterium]|nr:glycoside hydrolase family 20 zincin-like fold domain-containing protein [Blastocatellia bacterium]